MENPINECQGDLFADRTSTATMRANRLRLWFASMAYMLVCALRRLVHTPLRQASRGSIRLALLKTGALITIASVVSSWPRDVPSRKTSGRPSPCSLRHHPDRPDSARALPLDQRCRRGAMALARAHRAATFGPSSAAHKMIGPLLPPATRDSLR